MVANKKKKKPSFYDFEGSCGIEKEIYQDKNYDKIDITLGECIGIPCIRIYGEIKGKQKPLLTLHLCEAIELKSIIDELVYNYHQDEIEKLKDENISEKEHEIDIKALNKRIDNLRDLVLKSTKKK